jgi:hypothetical protein
MRTAEANVTLKRVRRTFTRSKSGSARRAGAGEFRYAIAVSVAVGVLCFGVALIAAHFVGHLAYRPGGYAANNQT